MKQTRNILGTTRPIQKLADRYGITYDAMYRLADWVIHGRDVVEIINEYDRIEFSKVAIDLGIDKKELIQQSINHINAVWEDINEQAQKNTMVKD